MKYLLYLSIAACLFGCASTTSCYPGGEAVRAKKQIDSLNCWCFCCYQNLNLDYYSDLTYWFDGFEVSDKYIKKAKLPKAYQNYLADSLDGKRLLYTAMNNDKWPHYTGCYYIATITRPLTSPDLSRLTDIQYHPEISSYRTQYFHLPNGRKALCFYYTVLKNKKMAFNVLSFHTIWKDNQIISISIISSCKKRSYAYVSQDHADKLFQTMPIIED